MQGPHLLSRIVEDTFLRTLSLTRIVQKLIVYEKWLMTVQFQKK